MNIWIIVRLALVALFFLQGALSSQAIAPPEGASASLLLAAFAFGIVSMLFVIGIQRVNPWSAPTWRYPSWSINPFMLREPLQFFHFASFTFIAVGIGTALRSVVLGESLGLSVLFAPVIGAGTLGGKPLSDQGNRLAAAQLQAGHADGLLRLCGTEGQTGREDEAFGQKQQIGHGGNGGRGGLWPGPAALARRRGADCRPATNAPARQRHTPGP